MEEIILIIFCNVWILPIVLIVFYTLIAYIGFVHSNYRGISDNSFFDVNFNRNIKNEYYIYKKIKKIKFGKIINNIHLINGNDIININFVLIHPTGVYIFELVDYGEIHRNHFQECNNISYMNKILGHKYKNILYSYIIFNNKCSLRNDYNNRIVKDDFILLELSRKIKSREKVLSNQEINHIYSKLMLIDEKKDVNTLIDETEEGYTIQIV